MTDLNLQRVSEPETGEDTALDRIRALFAEAEQEKRLALKLPGDIGKLVRVRYQPRDDFEQHEGRAPIDTSLDYLIHLCDGVEIRTGSGWETVTGGNGQPVKFNHLTALKEMLGVNCRTQEEGGTVREAVLAMFRGAPNPSEAAGDHVLRLSRWMRTGEHRVDEEELLGEF